MSQEEPWREANGRGGDVPGVEDAVFHWRQVACQVIGQTLEQGEAVHLALVVLDTQSKPGAGVAPERPRGAGRRGRQCFDDGKKRLLLDTALTHAAISHHSSGDETENAVGHATQVPFHHS